MLFIRIEAQGDGRHGKMTQRVERDIGATVEQTIKRHQTGNDMIIGFADGGLDGRTELAGQDL